MTLSPHQILSRLAEQERTKAQEELAALGCQRKSLQEKRATVEYAVQQLIIQRDEVLKKGTEASMLLMMEAAMHEQQSSLLAIEAEMKVLYESEATLIQRWVTANQKHDSHGKMQKNLDKKQEKLHDIRLQKQMDDIFAAKYVRGDSNL